MQPLKLGVLGVSGHFIMRVLPALRRSEEVLVYGIASRDGAKAQEAADRYGISRAYPSYDALLDDPAIEAVYIPLPNDLHLEWIKRAADRGKAILCEKPLALNSSQAETAVAYARSKKVQLMEAFMYKFHPQWQRALEIVKYGEIGKVRSIHNWFGYHNVDPKNIRNIKENGGGALLDIGCYAVSSARFLMRAEPQRVLAVIVEDPLFGTDILVNGVLDFGEVRAMFTVGTQTFPQQKVTVQGSAGVLTVELPFNMFPDVPAKLTVQTGVGVRSVELGPADQYQLMFEAFAKAVRSGAEIPVSPEDAVANLKVLDALFRSGGSGGWETVN
ncbi:MAG: Gfo/Idh/MocA family protein [Bacteroidota bacterium]